MNQDLNDFLESLDEQKLTNQEKIDKLQYRYSINKLKDLSIKVLINGLYGAFGFKNFYFYNKDIAESITIQSQLLINIVGEYVERYFLEDWHKDFELHKILGASDVKKVSKSVWFYTDTDSCFYTLDEVRKSCKLETELDSVDFCYTIYENRLKDIFIRACKDYFDTYNAENTMVFDLEYIASRAIWISKKNYIVKFDWLDGSRVYKKKVKISGLPAVKSDTPLFFRNELKKMYEYILENDGGDLGEIISMLEVSKRAMKMEDVENICENKKISNYEKFVLNDRKHIEFKKGAPMQIKAAAEYNLLISEKDSGKYPRIENLDKVKIYFCKEGSFERFAFLPGYFPKEFAPKIDYDRQFNTYYLNKVNDIISIVHGTEITPALSAPVKLF